MAVESVDTAGQEGDATVSPQPMTSIEAAELSLRAQSMIKNHVMASGAAALLPLPLIDMAAITAVQLRMIAKLATMYGRSFSEHAVRNTLTALAGGVVGQSAGVVAAISLTKFIPGIGWMAGMISLPAIAGASTYAVGRVFQRHFERGGSVYDIGVENVRGYYNEQLEKGKKVANAAKQEIHKRTAPREQPA